MTASSTRPASAPPPFPRNATVGTPPLRAARAAASRLGLWPLVLCRTSRSPGCRAPRPGGQRSARSRDRCRRGQDRGVGGEGHRGERPPVERVADHVLGREMLRVGRAAAVAAEVQRAAAAQHLGVPGSDAGHRAAQRLRGLGRPGQRLEAFLDAAAGSLAPLEKLFDPAHPALADSERGHRSAAPRPRGWRPDCVRTSRSTCSKPSWAREETAPPWPRCGRRRGCRPRGCRPVLRTRAGGPAGLGPGRLSSVVASTCILAPSARQRRTASTEQQLYRSGWARTGTRPSSTTCDSALLTVSYATSRGNSTRM